MQWLGAQELQLENLEDIERYLQANSVSALNGLFYQCRRRFIASANLVGADFGQWPALREVSMSLPVDFAGLIPFWMALGTYCRDIGIGVQAELFGSRMAWGEQFVLYANRRIWPQLVDEDRAVRAVLRLTNALPCEDAGHECKTLRQLMRELKFELVSEEPWSASQFTS